MGISRMDDPETQEILQTSGLYETGTAYPSQTSGLYETGTAYPSQTSGLYKTGTTYPSQTSGLYYIKTKKTLYLNIFYSRTLKLDVLSYFITNMINSIGLYLCNLNLIYM
jgi:hypothetical protein